ncbi:unnamed protein product [Urochloa humidicola]
MSPPPALAPAMPMGMVHLARSKLIQEDLFSETCRKDSFCLSCNHAFCSHCCFYHHVHSWGTKMMVKVSLDAATGQPVLPTHTNEGYSIMRCMVEEMAAEDFTSRLPRDAFCLYCGKSFSAAVCSHHDDHRAEGLPDAVIRVEERGGRRCVRCAGTEWWTSHLDVVLGDPVHVGEDDQGRYYELLPVLRTDPGTCMRCGVALQWHLGTHCSSLCHQAWLRETDERRRRREARHAALALGNN